MRNYWKVALLVSLISGFVYFVFLFFQATSGGDISLDSCLVLASLMSIVAILISIVLYNVDEKKYSRRNHEPPSFSLALTATTLAFAIKALWSCFFRPDDFWIRGDFIFTLIMSSVSLLLSIIFAVYLLHQAIKQEEASETEPGIIRMNSGIIIYTYNKLGVITIFLFFLIIQTILIWWIPNLFLWLMP